MCRLFFSLSPPLRYPLLCSTPPAFQITHTIQFPSITRGRRGDEEPPFFVKSPRGEGGEREEGVEKPLPLSPPRPPSTFLETQRKTRDLCLLSLSLSLSPQFTILSLSLNLRARARCSDYPSLKKGHIDEGRQYGIRSLFLLEVFFIFICFFDQTVFPPLSHLGLSLSLPPSLWEIE